MNTKDQIKALLKKTGSISATSTAAKIGISRQAVSKHMKDLIDSGIVVKFGTTKGASFRLAKEGKESSLESVYTRRFILKGLQEDEVFREASSYLGLRRQVSVPSFDILHYAFTELLNNAIDHSKSSKCEVEFVLDSYNAIFAVRDFGIGVFHSIQSGLGLPDESSAINEILKGKATTMASRHSGEGIFFTSRMADSMTLRSHRITVIFGREEGDSRVEVSHHKKGTEAIFAISRRSKKSSRAIFQKYETDESDHRFDKTHILIHLQAEESVSRSAAKRVMNRLENFKQVDLDFGHVKKLGQAFADQIFRILLKDNPKMKLRVLRLKPSLKGMIKHVVDEETAERITYE